MYCIYAQEYSTSKTYHNCWDNKNKEVKITMLSNFQEKRFHRELNSDDEEECNKMIWFIAAWCFEYLKAYHSFVIGCRHLINQNDMSYNNAVKVKKFKKTPFCLPGSMYLLRFDICIQRAILICSFSCLAGCKCYCQQPTHLLTIFIFPIMMLKS